MRTVDAAGLSIGDDHPPRIMGVLNVSKESPYDPSVYDDSGEAAAYVDDQLIDEGADIVDVGLESANKRLDVLSPEEELDRLDTAIETIESVGGDAVFSIETRYATVAEEALRRGFEMVNDVCGFADPDMPAVCRDYDVAVCKMASPPDLERPGAVSDIDWATRRSPEWDAEATFVDRAYEALKQNGLTDKTIVDPAFGGWSEQKSIADDRETFRRLREFRGLDRPILVSINRKNFLRHVADCSTEEALPVSLAATSMAVERGANVVRTHDVAETRDAALIGNTFTDRQRVRGSNVTVTALDVERSRELDRHLDRLGIDSAGGDAVAHALEIEGLDGTAVESLRAVAAQSGATVEGNGDGIVLWGSETALGATGKALDGSDFAPVVEAIRATIAGTSEGR